MRLPDDRGDVWPRRHRPTRLRTSSSVWTVVGFPASNLRKQQLIGKASPAPHWKPFHTDTMSSRKNSRVPWSIGSLAVSIGSNHTSDVVVDTSGG